MQRLQHIVFIFTFLFTATAFSQETASETIFTEINAPTTEKTISIKRETFHTNNNTFEISKEETQLAIINVHISAKKKALKSGGYIWTGKQWRTKDTSIIAYDKGMA